MTFQEAKRTIDEVAFALPELLEIKAKLNLIRDFLWKSLFKYSSFHHRLNIIDSASYLFDFGKFKLNLAGKFSVFPESWIDDSRSKEQVEKVKSLLNVHFRFFPLSHDLTTIGKKEKFLNFDYSAWADIKLRFSLNRLHFWFCGNSDSVFDLLPRRTEEEVLVSVCLSIQLINNLLFP